MKSLEKITGKKNCAEKTRVCGAVIECWSSWRLQSACCISCPTLACNSIQKRQDWWDANSFRARARGGFVQHEPGKEESLLFEVRVQAFHDLVQQPVTVDQFLQQTFHGRRGHHLQHVWQLMTKAARGGFSVGSFVALRCLNNFTQQRFSKPCRQNSVDCKQK